MESYSTPLHNRLDEIFQTSTVDSFYNQFEAVRAWYPWLSELEFTNWFIYGLRYDVQTYVIQFRPETVLDAYYLACSYEYNLYPQYFPESRKKDIDTYFGQRVLENEAKIHASTTAQLREILATCEEIQKIFGRPRNILSDNSSDGTSVEETNIEMNRHSELVASSALNVEDLGASIADESPLSDDDAYVESQIDLSQANVESEITGYSKEALRAEYGNVQKEMTVQDVSVMEYLEEIIEDVGEFSGCAASLVIGVCPTQAEFNEETWESHSVEGNVQFVFDPGEVIQKCSAHDQHEVTIEVLSSAIPTYTDINICSTVSVEAYVDNSSEPPTLDTKEPQGVTRVKYEVKDIKEVTESIEDGSKICYKCETLGHMSGDCPDQHAEQEVDRKPVIKSPCKFTISFDVNFCLCFDPDIFSITWFGQELNLIFVQQQILRRVLITVVPRYPTLDYVSCFHVLDLMSGVFLLDTKLSVHTGVGDSLSTIVVVIHPLTAVQLAIGVDQNAFYLQEQHRDISALRSSKASFSALSRCSYSACRKNGQVDFSMVIHNSQACSTINKGRVSVRCSVVYPLLLCMAHYSGGRSQSGICELRIVCTMLSAPPIVHFQYDTEQQNRCEKRFEFATSFLHQFNAVVQGSKVLVTTRFGPIPIVLPTYFRSLSNRRSLNVVELGGTFLLRSKVYVVNRGCQVKLVTGTTSLDTNDSPAMQSCAELLFESEMLFRISEWHIAWSPNSIFSTKIELTRLFYQFINQSYDRGFREYTHSALLDIREGWSSSQRHKFITLTWFAEQTCVQSDHAYHILVGGFMRVVTRLLSTLKQQQFRKMKMHRESLAVDIVQNASSAQTGKEVGLSRLQYLKLLQLIQDSDIFCSSLGRFNSCFKVRMSSSFSIVKKGGILPQIYMWVFDMAVYDAYSTYYGRTMSILQWVCKTNVKEYLTVIYVTIEVVEYLYSTFPSTGSTSIPRVLKLYIKVLLNTIKFSVSKLLLVAFAYLFDLQCTGSLSLRMPAILIEDMVLSGEFAGTLISVMGNWLLDPGIVNEIATANDGTKVKIAIYWNYGQSVVLQLMMHLLVLNLVCYWHHTSVGPDDIYRGGEPTDINMRCSETRGMLVQYLVMQHRCLNTRCDSGYLYSVPNRRHFRDSSANGSAMFAWEHSPVILQWQWGDKLTGRKRIASINAHNGGSFLFTLISNQYILTSTMPDHDWKKSGDTQFHYSILIIHSSQIEKLLQSAYCGKYRNQDTTARTRGLQNLTMSRYRSAFNAFLIGSLVSPFSADIYSCYEEQANVRTSYKGEGIRLDIFAGGIVFYVWGGLEVGLDRWENSQRLQYFSNWECYLCCYYGTYQLPRNPYKKVLIVEDAPTQLMKSDEYPAPGLFTFLCSFCHHFFADIGAVRMSSFRFDSKNIRNSAINLINFSFQVQAFVSLFERKWLLSGNMHHGMARQLGPLCRFSDILLEASLGDFLPHAITQGLISVQIRYAILTSLFVAPVLWRIAWVSISLGQTFWFFWQGLCSKGGANSAGVDSLFTYSCCWMLDNMISLRTRMLKKGKGICHASCHQ